MRLVEGQFVGSHTESVAAMLRGSRAELALRPARVLFKPLELPQRATEFLDGVVRAQIDRLTPWTANDAAFGWSTPVVAGADRMVVTVAATARALVQPLVEALAAAGAEAVTVTATPPDAAPITVLDHHARGAVDFARVRRVLVALLLGSGLARRRVALRRRRRQHEHGEPTGRPDTPHRGAPHGDPCRPRTRRRPRRRCARWSGANTRARRA